ncbi:MAG: hypothetical protein JW881_19045 [Spirochaetales bacterium]|nr:hypothetical protein [Spirochaetales bacterium]
MDDKRKYSKKKPLKPGRIFGYVLITLGIINFINLGSPIPVPTIGLSAIAAGIIFTAGGLILLVPDKRSILKKITEYRKKTEPPKPLADPMLPVKILKLAREHKGILTLSDVAIELNIPLDEAEAGLKACLRSGQAVGDFDMSRETTYYRFHEYLPPDNSES